MPANRPIPLPLRNRRAIRGPTCRARRSWPVAALLTALVLSIVWLSGCAGGAVVAPSIPDESALAPAEQALAKARSAQADTFAPRTVDAARRRIATARDILYGAARADRPVTDGEKARVQQLVAAAQLDARAALVQTQAEAVRSQRRELRGQPGGRRAPAADRSSSAAGASP